MQTICKNCYYWCWSFIMANEGFEEPYDYSRSFCGLHGGTEILDPNKPITFDLLNGGINKNYKNAKCGFSPKRNLIPVQLSLFDF